MDDNIDPQWQALLAELNTRNDAAEAMGGAERLQRQVSKGRLNARERVALLCDPGSFAEYGVLGAGSHPSGSAPIPADGLVGGVARVHGRAIVCVAEDFTVQGGSIGHVNSAKRLRLSQLAAAEQLPFVIMLDGAGERASNAEERYPLAPSDLQTLADLSGRVPMVTLVLGTSAGHGALSGLFSDLVIASEGAAMFAAGPPLVKASLGIDVTPDELGSVRMHATESGVVHNLYEDERTALEAARTFLALLCDPAGTNHDSDDTQPRRLDSILDLVPVDLRRGYEIRTLLEELTDRGSLLEVQPLYGGSIVTAFARLGGRTVLIVANDPLHSAGAITREGAEKAAHFLGVAGNFDLPVVFLADTPGVMAGPAAERAGTLKAAAMMYAAQRKLSGPKLHVTLRKAFGFGSSLMAMNPFDRQSVTIAFPGITLGGVPAMGGADASNATEEERARMLARQSGAWSAADNASYDRVIDPRDLRNELLRALGLSAQN
jgi:acetyl-CoA carboxylase carboxyltransferase component